LAGEGTDLQAEILSAEDAEDAEYCEVNGLDYRNHFAFTVYSSRLGWIFCVFCGNWFSGPIWRCILKICLHMQTRWPSTILMNY